MKVKPTVIALEREIKVEVIPPILDKIEMIVGLLDYCEKHRYMVSFVPVEELPDED